MKVFIEGIFLQVSNNAKWKLEENVFIRKFEGKHHLRKELPQKAKVFSSFYEPVFMLVIQDQDSNDCKILKKNLFNLIQQHDFLNFKIRIVCRELECWYLGDFQAIENVVPESKASNYALKAKFRNPDLLNGKEELKSIVSKYRAIEFAGKMSRYVNIEANRSISFQHTITTLKEILQ